MNKTGIAGLMIAALALAVAGCHRGPKPEQTGMKQPPPKPQTIAAASTAGYGATAAAPAMATFAAAKLSPELTAMAKKVQMASSASAAQALSNKRIHVDAHGQIQVYVYVKSVDSATQAQLEQAGGKVERGVASMKVYQLWAGPSALARISRMPDVVRITPPAYGFTR